MLSGNGYQLDVETLHIGLYDGFVILNPHGRYVALFSVERKYKISNNFVVSEPILWSMSLPSEIDWDIRGINQPCYSFLFFLLAKDS